MVAKSKEIASPKIKTKKAVTKSEAPAAAVIPKTKTNLSKVTKKTKKPKKKGMNKSPKKSAVNNDACTLFIKKLPENVTEAELRELTSDALVSVRIQTDQKVKKEILRKKKTDNCFQLAFLEFADAATAENNYEAIQFKELNGKRVIVRRIGEKDTNITQKKKKLGTKKEEIEAKLKVKDLKRVHIIGFDKVATTEEDIKSLFSGYIEFTMPVKKDTTQHMGFAFVGFKTEAEAKRAIEATKGTELNGHKLNIDYAFVRPDEATKRAATWKPPTLNKNKKVKKPKTEGDKAKGGIKRKLKIEDNDDQAPNEEENDARIMKKANNKMKKGHSLPLI